MKRFAATVITVLALPFAARAQGVLDPAPSGGGRVLAVFDPVTIGVDVDQGQTVADMIRDEMRNQGYQVLPRTTMQNTVCADELCAAEKGKALGAQEAVILKVSRLEQKVLVIGAIVDVASGRVEYSDRATALSLDDMDAVAPRFARSLARHEPFANTITPDTVTMNEAKEPLRQKAFFTTGLRISGMIPVGESYSGISYLYGAEWVNYYEVRQYAIEAALGGMWTPAGEKYKGVDVSGGEYWADLGGYYYLRDADVSPFLGGGVGLHGIAINQSYTDNTGTTVTNDYAQTGMSVWAGGGVTLLRSADVHLVGTAKYMVDLFPVNGKNPNGVMLGLSVTYTKRGSTCCLW